MANFDITIKYIDRKFRVKGSASPYVPAKTNCPPEDSHPAEGGIEEITEVRLLDDKGNEVPLPEFLQEYLEEQVIEENLFDDEISEALSDIEGDYE